ncbi:hypothetical protein [Frankia sp. KB5]|uniref:hypothetical protein n=1 Tax=Frankia sp. KB5 TaxID=683318 RepID=UPI000A10CD79|nr:hypothetical protein [Frankia sp. KB5]ORT53028.1 hypothetical protein KBI5_08685 [Frankia sp. KB5]
MDYPEGGEVDYFNRRCHTPEGAALRAHEQDIVDLVTMHVRRIREAFLAASPWVVVLDVTTAADEQGGTTLRVRTANDFFGYPFLGPDSPLFQGAAQLVAPDLAAIYRLTPADRWAYPRHVDVYNHRSWHDFH